MTPAESGPTELEDRWLLGWRGLLVNQLCLSYQLGLQIGPDVWLSIEERTLIGRVSSAGPPEAIDPEAGEFAAALPLLRTTVLSSVAFKSGSLRVVFSSGHRLDVPPSAKYEAWTATGPGSARWVCTPGGELAIWT
jgi:uncharacterized protein DUF6188